MFANDKELKLYDYLMIYFGILDVVYLAIDILEDNSLPDDYHNAVAIFVYIFYGVRALFTLCKFWMGRQALCYANGTGKGTSHIRLAKITIIFTALVLAADVVSYINGTASFSEALSTLANLIVICSYYSAAKACL